MHTNKLNDFIWMDDAWTRNEWAGDTSGHDPNLRDKREQKALLKVFPAEWHWNVILAVFPIHTAEYTITVALFLMGTFTTKVGTGRGKSFDEADAIGGASLVF